ncbi:MAG: hypothetical protein ACI843_002178 [Psychrobacter glaciei]|jgi:hypothetical protein
MNTTGLNIRLILIVIALLCVQGCSSKFAYNNADWLANWYIDDYLDLSPDQNRILEKELESVLVWHRQTQLPQYRQSLLKISNDLNNLPISETAWRQHFNRITGFWHTARNELSLRSSKLAPLLNQGQVDYLFKKLHEKNLSKLEDFNDQTIEEYRDQRYEKLSDTVKDYLGTLTKEQQEYVLEFTQNAIVTEQEWFDSKLSLQTAMKEAFKLNQSADLSNQLFLLMSNPDQFKPKSLIDVYDNNRQLLITMLHKLSASLTLSQVEHFQQSINDLLENLDDLISDNAG